MAALKHNVGAADDRRAIGGGSAGEGQRCAFRVAVIGQHLDGHAHVFQRVGAVVVGEGGSLTGVTVTVTLAVAELVPSETV